MEHILTPKVENVKLVDKFSSRNSVMGTLYLTTTHLIFVSSNASDAANGPAGTSDQGPSSSAGQIGSGPKKELWILHMLIQTLEKPLLTTSGTQLRIICSHFQNATFIIQRDRDAHDVYLSLLALSTPKTVQDLYCFSYNPKGELRQSTGWHFHDIQAEYQRQGVPNQHWSYCNMNNNYKLCPTYPKHLYIPSSATKSVVEGSAKFRSKGRLPVLSYYYATNGACIVRCAQPLVGISGLRSPQDESYVECIRKTTPRASQVYIVDTRPAMNAYANRAGGKGYESDKYYENIQFFFKGIDNIHKMRSSLKALVASVTSAVSMDTFISELSNSGWLKHIKAVLDASVFIMSNVVEGRPVIVHCSDGWDRTGQTCALASLMLDGYYRTIQGFQALIEKEWLAFGHKFSDRCGHLDGDPNEVSPIFTQFLDATWQLTQQCPHFFQFNERYLITIHEHVYSSQYGTFIGNCEREREALQLKEKTYSLWGYLVTNNDEYVNPLYDAKTQRQVLRPNTLPQYIRFWSGLYCRFENGAHPREHVIDLLSITQSQVTSLEDHGRQLSKTIGQMTQMIANSKAVKKMIPASSSANVKPYSSSISSGVSTTSQQRLPSDVGTMEQRFAGLKTTVVEKCQSRGFISRLMAESIPIIQNSMVNSIATSKHQQNRDIKATTKGEIVTNIDPGENVFVSKMYREDLADLFESVAVDWTPLRYCSECFSCGYPLENSVAKVHCRKCGQVMCKRCMVRKAVLPGHLSEIPVFVCNTCFKSLHSQEDDSFDTFSH